MLLSFNSSVGGMTFENQFLQMSSLLPSDVLYGLGEHSAPLLLDVKWQRASLFARDVATPEVRRETEFTRKQKLLLPLLYNDNDS